ncbi:unnamed protein product [Anisakis simplex]|uniref:Cytosolic carboxypeptidase 1 (inferred by orthology to a C. elegans protein) n=1 Tax=Anisakis simplex TaxID=6269 RepID=A0A158PNB7_ANISI|nr:unnamed protein product [Anisakis simplex]
MYTNSDIGHKVGVSCGVVDESCELTNLFVHLIDEIILNAHISVQRRIAQQISDLFTDEIQQRASTYRFLLCLKKTNSGDGDLMKGDGDDCVHMHCSDDLMIRCLKAVQLASDESARLLLCRLMQGYISHCKPAAMERRERRLVRLDATIYVMRALLKTLLEDTTVSSQSIVVDNLSEFLLKMSNRDRKFTLKFRLVGLIGVLYNRIFAGKELQCSETLIRLMCRGVRSQKCKSALIDGMIIPVIQGLFERYFAMITLNDVDRRGSRELCLISLACIGQLSKMKKGHEQLIANGVIEMCECALNSITDDLKILSEDLPLLSYLLKLQNQFKDLLCALCMRCLPAKPYPLSSSQLSFSFQIPLSRPTISIQHSVDNSPPDGSTNPLKITAAVFRPPQNISLNSSNSDENGSAVEEEERKEREDCLWVVRKDGGMRSCLQNICDDDTDNLVDDVKEKCSLLYQNQSYDQLTRNYAAFFAEFLQSSTNLSSTFNAQSSVVISRSELVALIAQQTNPANNRFVKIAFPELLDRIVECRQQPLQHNTASISYLLNKSCNLSSQQVNKHHYELILSPDTNQKRPHYQWFYFEVSNNEANVPYTFEVINCIKSTSMFSKGMQPVMFSVTDACLHDQCEWKRTGSSICYYRNLYALHSNSVSNKSNKKISAKSKQKRCLPISGTIVLILQINLERTMMRLNKLSSPHSFYMRNDTLCYSLAGNTVPLITITAFGTNEQINQREIVLLSARVHPGESNASWMMHGVIEFLSGSSSDAIELRNHFVFKLIPMLNTDGVINGNHRCGLAGTDLNRCWDVPSSLFHPTIFHSKGLVQYVVDVLKKKPFAYIDFHGHSRRYNVFMFGNNPKQSWKLSDRTLSDCYDLDQFMLLPHLLSQVSRSFSFSECCFNITKAKESSARVVLWRQFGINCVYTMEATYCGYSNGPYANNHIGIFELKEIGRDLCIALLAMKKKSLECVGTMQNSTILKQHHNADSTSVSD